MGGKELAPKVEATYEAVIQLLVEGVDLNNLTVSEITGRAGIGKGTVYDYFSNKEEMIAGALYYEMEKACRNLYRQARQEKGLYDKIDLILISMEKQMVKISCFARMIYVMMDNSVIGCKLREMVKNKDEDEMMIADLIRRIITDEMENMGEMPEAEKNYLVMTVFSRIICFAMYQLGAKKIAGLDSSTMREMICKDVCKSVESYKEENCNSRSKGME